MRYLQDAPFLLYIQVGGLRMAKRAIYVILFISLVIFGSAGCGSTNSTPVDSTQTGVPQSASPSPTPLKVTGLTTTVTPDNLSGVSCGSAATFTFSTVIAVLAGSSGGPLAYTWNIGSSQIHGSVTFAPGDASKTVTYMLNSSSVQPDTASSVTGSLSVNNNGSTLTSTPASATGICTYSGAFKVVSISLSVSPSIVTGIPCDSYITFVYSATIAIAPDTNGGSVLLKWSFSSSSIAITFGPYQPGQTTKTITFSLTGKVIHNQVFPPAGSISSLAPNALTSVKVKPFGPCLQA